MESLTLEQAYYFAEIIGVVIVIMSLIYVGKQISQNNRSQRMAAVQSHNDTYRQNLSLIADHTETWIAGLKGYSDLDAPRKVEFGMVIQALIRHIEQSYFMVREGVLEENTYLSALSNASNVLSYPGAREWWLTRREFFDLGFIESLESYMKKIETKDIYQIIETQE